MKRVVVVGGGSGTFNVLKGLKHYPVAITAIVTAFDSGGSSGLLRDEFGTLPPGDVRRCLVALAPEGEDTTLRDLFSFRFKKDSSLQGHNFGNLFLQALIETSGGELEAIRRAARLLNIKGAVLPVSTDRAHLCAELEDGAVIKGETNIDIPKHDGALKITRVFLEPAASLCDDARRVLQEADLIIFGPGDLYSSIIPNTLVRGFGEAVKKSRAKTCFVMNAMTKWGETNGFAAPDFAKELLHYLRLSRFDFIICNASSFEPELLARYKKERAEPVAAALPALRAYTHAVLHEDVLHRSDIVRHDPQKLAAALARLLDVHREG